MVLDQAVVDWLRRNLAQGITAHALAQAYSFSHELHGQPTLRHQAIEKWPEPEHFRWRLDLRHPDGRDLLEIPLQRRAFAQLPLYGGGRGAVVRNNAFHLLEDFQNQKYGRALYAAEATLYVDWGVREIHLTAVELGRVIWPKYFDFQPVEPSFIADEYRRWQQTHSSYPSEPPSDPALYPVDFLLSMDKIMLYKVLS